VWEVEYRECGWDVWSKAGGRRCTPERDVWELEDRGRDGDMESGVGKVVRVCDGRRVVVFAGEP
jgi:hypothetical protein